MSEDSLAFLHLAYMRACASHTCTVLRLQRPETENGDSRHAVTYTQEHGMAPGIYISARIVLHRNN